jgi:hypothetical protein
MCSKVGSVLVFEDQVERVVGCKELFKIKLMLGRFAVLVFSVNQGSLESVP